MQSIMQCIGDNDIGSHEHPQQRRQTANQQQHRTQMNQNRTPSATCCQSSSNIVAEAAQTPPMPPQLTSASIVAGASQGNSSNQSSIGSSQQHSSPSQRTTRAETVGVQAATSKRSQDRGPITLLIQSLRQLGASFTTNGNLFLRATGNALLIVPCNNTSKL